MEKIKIYLTRTNDETIEINGVEYCTYVSHRLRNLSAIEREMNQLRQRLSFLECEAQRLAVEIINEEGGV